VERITERLTKERGWLIKNGQLLVCKKPEKSKNIKDYEVCLHAITDCGIAQSIGSKTKGTPEQPWSIMGRRDNRELSVMLYIIGMSDLQPMGVIRSHLLCFVDLPLKSDFKGWKGVFVLFGCSFNHITI